MLQEFIRFDKARKGAFGQVDCCLAPADWLVWLGYPDCAEDLRGTYHDAATCRAVVEKAGGLVALGDRVLRVGWVEIDHPVDGCVAVVGNAVDLNRQWGAIFYDGKWLLRTTEGHERFTAHAVKMWFPGDLVAEEQLRIAEARA